MTDLREQLKTFLQSHPPAVLSAVATPDRKVDKAGLLPYLSGDTPETAQIYVMKPREDKPYLGAPPWQICKGTRMLNVGGAWVDMRGEVSSKAVLEPLEETALREGIEELGLELDNIEALMDAGVVQFASATNGRPKSMRLFLARMIDADNFAHDRDVALTTAHRAWMNVGDFLKQGRKDHVGVVQQVMKFLV